MHSSASPIERIAFLGGNVVGNESPCRPFGVCLCVLILRQEISNNTASVLVCLVCGNVRDQRRVLDS